MSEWQNGKIADICSDMFSGGTPSTSNPQYWNGGIPWLSSGETKNPFIVSTVQTITKEAVDSSSTRLAKKYDIVMASAGQGKTRGQVSLLKIDTYINQSVITIRSNANMHYGFLYYYLKSQYNGLRGSSDGSSIRGSITTKDLKQYPIRYPSIQEQEKISHFLFSYDNFIENNNRRIAILEEMAQRLYREWFVHFRFPGHENVEMVESALGMIPEGWGIKQVKEIVSRRKNGVVYTEKMVQENGAFPVIDQSTSDVLGYHDGDANHIASADKPLAIFGDHTCKMQLMLKPFSIGPNVVAFTAKQGYRLIYVFYAVKNLVETKEYKRHWNELMNKVVICPVDAIEELFANQVTPLLNQIDYLKEKNNLLRKTRDLLLPRLISGDIDVSSVDIPV